MTILVLAFLLGGVCGLRSMTAPAVVCWGAHLGWIHLEKTPLAFLQHIVALIIFTLAAAGELVADKLPFVPSRTTAGPLAARVVLGGLCGAALTVAGGGLLAIGAVAGAVGGLAGAFAGYSARHALVSKAGIPDIAVALVEDLIAVGGGLLIVSHVG